MLGAEEFRGQVTFTADWGEGFPNAEVVSGEQLAK
jgi:hypothetical protein